MGGSTVRRLIDERSGRRRGLAIAVALTVLMILIIIGVAMSTVGIQNLNLVSADRDSKGAFYAAEAGIARALHEVKNSNTWNTGFSNTVLDITGNSYEVAVTNNSTGMSTVTAADGTSVPKGLVYIRSTGHASSGRVNRILAVMVQRGASNQFNYAIATGGDVELSAQTDITGTIKTSGKIDFMAACNIIPKDGEGRVLSSQTIYMKADTVMDSTQDMRARSTVTNPDKLLGTTELYPNDTTTDTLPFLADGSTTPPASGDQQALPNPDTGELLAAGTYTEHSETVIAGTLNLGGGVHYFPNGINFTPTARIVGEGTIVVGNGTTGQFDCPLGAADDYAKCNIIALDGSNGTTGGSKLNFTRSIFVNGLIYSHGDVYGGGANFRVKGSVICYGNGTGNLNSKANTDFALEPLPVVCPGFEAWLGGGSGATSVTILSWEHK